jgi:tRNA 2-thiouridine synthesizing protein A
VATTVDARGLACPLPLALAKGAMDRLPAGATLIVLATDPEAPIDIGAWAAGEGHALEARDGDGYLEFALIKGG